MVIVSFLSNFEYNIRKHTYLVTSHVYQGLYYSEELIFFIFPYNTCTNMTVMTLCYYMYNVEYISYAICLSLLKLNTCVSLVEVPSLCIVMYCYAK